MEFDQKALEVYKELVTTTDLQKGYQEFIKMFKNLKKELEAYFSEDTFSKGIVENRMDFAYFQMTNQELKEKGLKIQVVFVHKKFQLEVWISGYNRHIQEEFYSALKEKKIEYVINHNPQRVDYIVKQPLSNELNYNQSDLLVEQVKFVIDGMKKFAQKMD